MPTWLGIDIGSESVKVALVRSTYRKVSLARLASAKIDESGGQVEAVRAAVAAVLEGEKQGTDATAVAIEGARAAIHRLMLPGTAQKQLSEVLAYELEAQIPFDLDGAVFDWRQLERVTTEDGQIPIVTAVARVEDVRARIQLVKDAITQEPERVGVGAFALAALVPVVAGLADEGTVAILDLGWKASEVLILEHGEPVFARTLSTGVTDVPDKVDRLARDLRVSLAAHRAQGGTVPTRIFLCGGGAFVQGAEGFLSGALEIPVQILPEPAIDLTAIGPDLPHLPVYAKAVALALSLAGRGAGLNLRRGALTFERGFAWVRERIPILAGLAAVILVSFVFSAWARMHAVHSERNSLQAALGTVTKDVLGTEATSAQDAQDLLTKQGALNDEDPMPHADAFDVMVMISKAVPQKMTHDIDEFDVQKGHVTLRGIVGSIDDGQEIATNLQKERCLSDVKIKNWTQAVGNTRQKYVMEFDIKCPEDVHAPPKKKGDTSPGSSASPSESK
jgi:general secretion pathway protein L